MRTITPATFAAKFTMKVPQIDSIVVTVTDILKARNAMTYIRKLQEWEIQRALHTTDVPIVTS